MGQGRWVAGPQPNPCARNCQGGWGVTIQSAVPLCAASHIPPVVALFPTNTPIHSPSNCSHHHFSVPMLPGGTPSCCNHSATESVIWGGPQTYASTSCGPVCSSCSAAARPAASILPSCIVSCAAPGCCCRCCPSPCACVVRSCSCNLPLCCHASNLGSSANSSGEAAEYVSNSGCCRPSRSTRCPSIEDRHVMPMPPATNRAGRCTLLGARVNVPPTCMLTCVHTITPTNDGVPST